MTRNELREKVRLAINQSRLDNDRIADTAAIAIAIVGEACAGIFDEDAERHGVFAVYRDGRADNGPAMACDRSRRDAARIRALTSEKPQ